jgi:hypothetical protein
MSRHKDAARPPANRHKGTSDNAEISKSKEMAKTKAKVNTAEQGDPISSRTPRMPVSSRDGE